MERAEQVFSAFKKAEHGAFGALSTGETLAVAMVLNRFDLLGRYTMLEAFERLGPEWVRGACVVRQMLAPERIERASQQISMLIRLTHTPTTAR